MLYFLCVSWKTSSNKSAAAFRPAAKLSQPSSFRFAFMTISSSGIFCRISFPPPAPIQATSQSKSPKFALRFAPFLPTCTRRNSFCSGKWKICFWTRKISLPRFSLGVPAIASSVLNNSSEISSCPGAHASFKFQSIEAHLVWLVALALIAGVLMSLVCGWYILRLDRQGRLRYQALNRSRLELEGLSARLVQAQEEERRSISRELHDEVGQSLGALLVDVARLSKLVPSEDRITQAQIAQIKSVAETAVKSIRDIALLLRPPMLDDLGLVPALEWQAREISRRSDMEVEVQSQNVSEDLGDEIKVTIYRLVQEALNNAANHASAKNAKVTILQGQDKIAVEISDDGQGFDPERKRGMGILGMEERVRRLGGALSINSAPGNGATVKAELPVLPAESPVSPS